MGVLSLILLKILSFIVLLLEKAKNALLLTFLKIFFNIKLFFPQNGKTYVFLLFYAISLGLSILLENQFIFSSVFLKILLIT